MVGCVTTPVRAGSVGPSPVRVAAALTASGRKRSLADRAEEEQELHRTLSESHLAAGLQLDADVMDELKQDIYERCGKRRKMLHWAKCPKFILDPLIERMMVLAKVTPQDTFLDIGSGVGNVVESMATRVGCNGVGIEIAKVNHEVAMAAKPLFAEYRSQHGLREAKTEFVCGDIMKMADGMDYINNASVIWCSNKLFPIEVNSYLVNAFKETPPGTRIFVMNNLYNHHRPSCKTQAECFKYFKFTDFAWGAGDVEWTNAPGCMYMYTRTDYVEGDDSDDASSQSSLPQNSSDDN
eukprot:TRINITY_DN2677_c0_g1_i1.p2 TRINITY_DN2677_c0_g1~~TRINITY_DN2677_c0_g1_i1.p2  ORF type:complete len:295 (+),score=132.56 TRINITY_DN2677_c0_g1_i1:72-956(+)